MIERRRARRFVKEDTVGGGHETKAFTHDHFDANHNNLANPARGLARVFSNLL